MIITNRQKKKMASLLDEFTQANKVHGFDLKSINFYMDEDKEVVVMKIEYARTLVNVIDSKMEIHVIDKKGAMSPLTWNIPDIKDQVKYLEKLQIVKI